MMGGHISQLVQSAQMSDSCRIAGGIGGREIDGETKSLEVLADILKVRVPLIQFPVGRELLLKENLDRRVLDPRREDHRAFRIEIAAEALEVGGKQHDQPSKILVLELRVGRDQGSRRRALLLQLRDPDKSIDPPDAK